MPGFREHIVIHFSVIISNEFLVAPNCTEFGISSSFLKKFYFMLKRTNENILRMYHAFCNHLLSYWLTHKNDSSKGQSYVGRYLAQRSYSINEGTFWRWGATHGSQTATMLCLWLRLGWLSDGRYAPWGGDQAVFSLGQGGLLATEADSEAGSLGLVSSFHIQPSCWSPARSLGASRFARRFWNTVSSLHTNTFHSERVFLSPTCKFNKVSLGTQLTQLAI